jgi:hypothetical protein
MGNRRQPTPLPCPRANNAARDLINRPKTFQQSSRNIPSWPPIDAPERQVAPLRADLVHVLRQMVMAGIGIALILELATLGPLARTSSLSTAVSSCRAEARAGACLAPQLPARRRIAGAGARIGRGTRMTERAWDAMVFCRIVERIA